MIPLKVAKKNSEEDDMLEQIVNLLKEHPVVLALFDKFSTDIEHIHDIPMEFADLETSAKAKKGRLYFNKAFLEDGNFIDDIHYMVHELVHALQQKNGRVHERRTGDHYLDDPAEIEAFKHQVEFIDAYKDGREAERYVDDLLKFHEFDGVEKDNKKKELTERIRRA